MAQLFGSDNPLTTQLVALALAKSNSAKPNKSTGVSSKAKTYYNPAITGEELIKINARRNKKDAFTVNYYVGEKDGKEVRSTFIFALLPAIDHILNYSASGPFRGNESVPEVKPGIPIRTAMKHRNTVIPGGTNVVQTIGIDSKYIVLVGAFVGTEKSTSEAPAGSTFYDTIYQRIGNPKEQLPDYNSYKQAMLFNKEVVEKGAPVNITIQTEGQKADESIKVTGVIVDFKLQAVRESKTYYAMTVLYTDQKSQSAESITATSQKPQSTTATSQKPQSTTTTSQKPVSRVPVANNPTASTPDLKTLPAKDVVITEGLIGAKWTTALAQKIGKVYGFWGEADRSHITAFGYVPYRFIEYKYTRKDNKGKIIEPTEDNTLNLKIYFKEKNGAYDWYIEDAY
jgi:hypothetical protein